METHILTEVYLDFLGRTVPIHWNYHAILMVFIWAVMVPVLIITLRYFKPKPTKTGITTRIAVEDPKWRWFNAHKFGLYLAMIMSFGGMAVALVVSKGFSGSTHSVFGLLTIAMGTAQIISSLMRGSHGGRYYYTGVEDDPSTWRGDHFDMTPRRRKFQSYHRMAGYFTMFCAAGAIGSGLMQYPMPLLALAIVASGVSIFAVTIWLEDRGKHYDTYRAVFGNDPTNPHNEERRDL